MILRPSAYHSKGGHSRRAPQSLGGSVLDNLLFIYNPTAGKGQVAEKLSSVVDVFTKAGWLVTVRPTQSKGDATRIARELGPSFSRVVCAGGDGTPHPAHGGGGGTGHGAAKPLRLPELWQHHGDHLRRHG